MNRVVILLPEYPRQFFTTMNNHFRNISLLAKLAPIISKNLILNRNNRSDWFGNPGDIHVMLPVDVLAGDIASPGAAAKCQRERHAIIVVAAIAIAMGLVNHDPAHLNLRSQLDNMGFIGCMDSTGMPAAI